MTVILASQNYSGSNAHLANQGKRRRGKNLSFLSTSFVKQLLEYKRHGKQLPKTEKSCRYQVETTPMETPKRLGINDRSFIKMLPISEVMEKRKPSFDIAGTVVINGSKGVAMPEEEGHEKILATEELNSSSPYFEGFSRTIENYYSFKRTIEVWTVVLSLYARLRLDAARWTYLEGFTGDKQKSRRQRTASWLRERVLQLGPTFIKLGQFFSTRSDTLPREFVDELSKLQDEVPAFSSQKAKDLIERELGVPVDVLFKRFEGQPIAAASLGQVHRAILHNGEKVVVKVQRAGLKKLFDIDLRNLKTIAEYFQRNEILGDRDGNWTRIYEECAKMLYEEIDYINEGKNADKFRRDFRKINWVRVPVVFWDYTTSKVLTLEYIPGVKINQLAIIDAKGYQRSQIVSRAIESYLIQILKTGFFHGDPHPGNLAIDENGALIYYDFGMMGEIKSSTQKR